MTPIPAHLPVLALIRGDEGPAAHLLEPLLRRLEQAGIRPLVVGGHGAAEQPAAIAPAIARAAPRSDLVIVDGPWPPAAGVLALGTGRAAPPAAGPIFSCGSGAKIDACAGRITKWLARCLEATPLRGCILIGGKSSRMGRPKHLIRTADGRSWLEGTVDRLCPHVTEIILSGAGQVPPPLAHLVRLADLPGVAGPLTGLAAALRRDPYGAWLLLACDMPAVTAPSIAWLLGQRRPGTVAIIPRQPDGGKSEPLFAWYDFRCGPLVEELLEAGERKISLLCRYPGVREPLIPPALAAAWRNVNRPDELP